MQNLPERENSEWTLRKTIIRVIVYLFCAGFIWFGIDTLTNPPLTPKDYLRGIGEIVAASVYLFVDIRILISKNKRPNS